MLLEIVVNQSLEFAYFIVLDARSSINQMKI